MRALIMFAVVCVHVTTVFILIAIDKTPSFLAFGAALTTLHFTRESFMTITGIVLLITYFSRPLSVTTFWQKRFLLIGVPYLVWTFVYILFKGVYYEPTAYWHAANLGPLVLRSVFTGSQYYLYYLFVSMQLYVLFPLMLKGLRKFRSYHLPIFIGSFLLQVALMAYNRNVISNTPITTMPYLMQKLVEHRDQFILMYQFWFIGGGVVACHYERIRGFVARHWRLMLGVFLLSVVAVWGHYLIDRMIYGETEAKAQMVFQPIMIPYSLIVTLAILCLGYAWARRRQDAAWRPISRFVQVASDASFGILLIQPILIVFLEQLISALDHAGMSKWVHYGLWPVSIAAIYLASMLLSYWLGKVPVLSYVVGRKAERRSPSVTREAASV